MTIMLPQAIQSFDALVKAWNAWMWNMSWQVLWLVAILWLLERPLKRTSARLRYALWCLVLIRLMIPPTFALPTGIGWWCGGWFSQQLSAWSASPPALNIAGADVNPASAIDLSPGNGPASQWHVPTNWSSLFFALWLGFALAQFAWMLFGWYQVRRWLAQSSALDDATSQRVLAKAKQRVGIQCQVALRDSGRCVTPLVISGWRPIILLPTEVRESLSAAELETVLVHELTHIARRDGWGRLAQAMLGALYFFHPAVWLARYKLSRLCEEACDEQTVFALSGERRHYAQAIVKAATIIGYQPPHLALNMLGDQLPVKRRLQRILDPALTWSAAGRWQRALLVALLACLLLPSGEPSTLATPPSQLRQLGLRIQDDSVNNDIDNRNSTKTGSPNRASESAASAATTATTDDLELKALEQLKSVDFETRLSAYETLERIGTPRSLSELEAAFLNRRGLEQDAAKRALDHVWSIIRKHTSETTQSSRQFQNDKES